MGKVRCVSALGNTHHVIGRRTEKSNQFWFISDAPKQMAHDGSWHGICGDCGEFLSGLCPERFYPKESAAVFRVVALKFRVVELKFRVVVLKFRVVEFEFKVIGLNLR